MNKIVFVLGILLFGNTTVGRTKPQKFNCLISKGDINHDHRTDEVLSCHNRDSDRLTRLIIFFGDRNEKYKNLVFDRTGILDFPKQNGAGFVIRDIWATIADGHLVIVVSGNSHTDFFIRYVFVIRHNEFVLAYQYRQNYLYCNPSIVADFTRVNLLPLDIKLKDFSLDCLVKYKIYRLRHYRIIPKKILTIYKRLRTRYSPELALGLITPVKRKQCTIDEFMQRYLFLDTKKHVRITNDIAYYLQKAGAYHEAIYLLKQIVAKFPNRDVAWLNLGDAYWDIGDKTKARKAYLIYVNLMRKKGLSKRIPQRVFRRLGLKTRQQVRKFEAYCSTPHGRGVRGVSFEEPGDWVFLPLARAIYWTGVCVRWRVCGP